MSASYIPVFSHRTCRHCQGMGCIHCHDGQVRTRLWRKVDPEKAATRAALLGDSQPTFRERQTVASVRFALGINS